MTYEEMEQCAIPIKWLVEHHMLIENVEGDVRVHLSPYDSSIPKIRIQGNGTWLPVPGNYEQ